LLLLGNTLPQGHVAWAEASQDDSTVLPQIGYSTRGYQECAAAVTRSGTAFASAS
jgi:hypothetical protein